MIDMLKSKLNDYAKLTVDAIHSVEVKDYDELNDLLKKRGNIIEELKKLNPCKDEINKIINELEIEHYEKILSTKINESKNTIKDEISRLYQAENANKNYYSAYQKKSIIFSKRV